MQNLNNAKLFVCFPKKTTESFQNEITQDLGKAIANTINSGNYTAATSLVSTIADTISGNDQKTVNQILSSAGVDISATKQEAQPNVATFVFASLIPK
jgi:hypothetical protein